MGFREMFRLLSLCLLVALFALGCHAHNHKVTVDWNAGFSSPAARAKSVTAGKHIVFSWTGTHNVYKMADKAAFDACNFAGSTQVGGATSPVTYNTSPSATGHIYFACNGPVFHHGVCCGVCVPYVAYVPLPIDAEAPLRAWAAAASHSRCGFAHRGLL